jgi:hypothetical protein
MRIPSSRRQVDQCRAPSNRITCFQNHRNAECAEVAERGAEHPSGGIIQGKFMTQNHSAFPSATSGASGKAWLPYWFETQPT